jgi:hypothetical protein
VLEIADGLPKPGEVFEVEGFEVFPVDFEVMRLVIFLSVSHSFLGCVVAVKAIHIGHILPVPAVLVLGYSIEVSAIIKAQVFAVLFIPFHYIISFQSWGGLLRPVDEYIRMVTFAIATFCICHSFLSRVKAFADIAVEFTHDGPLVTAQALPHIVKGDFLLGAIGVGNFQFIIAILVFISFCDTILLS